MALALKLSPPQSHTVHVVTNEPLLSAVTIQGVYEESLDVVPHGRLRFFTLSLTSSLALKPLPVRVAVERGI
jgi:hypothetical protein